MKWDVDMDWVDLAQDRQVAGTCECGDGPSGSIKLGEFLRNLLASQGLCCVELTA